MILDLSFYRRFLTICLQRKLRCGPKEMGLRLISKGFETTIGIARLEDFWNVQFSTRQLTLQVILQNLLIFLSTHENGLSMRHITNTFLIAIW